MVAPSTPIATFSKYLHMVAPSTPIVTYSKYLHMVASSTPIVTYSKYLHIVAPSTPIVMLSKSIPEYVLLTIDMITCIDSAMSCTDDTDIIALSMTIATGSNLVRPVSEYTYEIKIQVRHVNV